MAIKSLSKNINVAANTLLSIPTEAYDNTSEASGSSAAKAIIRAVPVAVLKPLTGVSEAVTKTLLGAQNTLDPSNAEKMEEKYK